MAGLATITPAARGGSHLAVRARLYGGTAYGVWLLTRGTPRFLGYAAGEAGGQIIVETALATSTTSVTGLLLTAENTAHPAHPGAIYARTHR